MTMKKTYLDCFLSLEYMVLHSFCELGICGSTYFFVSLEYVEHGVPLSIEHN